VPSNADALNSLDDLLKTVLPIHAGLQIDVMTLPFQSAQSQALTRRYQFHRGAFQELVKKNRNDVAYIVPRYLFATWFANTSYRVLPGLPINVVSIPFRLNRPSPFGGCFETAFMRAMGAGAVNKVWRERRIYEYLTIRSEGGGVRVESGPKPLTLESFGVLFSVWFVGCILSLISFIVEVWLHCSTTIFSSSLPPPTERLIYVKINQ